MAALVLVEDLGGEAELDAIDPGRRAVEATAVRGVEGQLRLGAAEEQPAVVGADFPFQGGDLAADQLDLGGAVGGGGHFHLEDDVVARQFAAERHQPHPVVLRGVRRREPGGPEKQRCQSY